MPLSIVIDGQTKQYNIGKNQRVTNFIKANYNGYCKDKDHQRLVKIFAKLHDLVKSTKQADVKNDGLKLISDLAKKALKDIEKTDPAKYYKRHYLANCVTSAHVVADSEFVDQKWVTIQLKVSNHFKKHGFDENLARSVGLAVTSDGDPGIHVFRK